MRIRKIALALSITAVVASTWTPALSVVAAEASTSEEVNTSDADDAEAAEVTDETAESEEISSEEDAEPDYWAEAEERKTALVQTNMITGWPQGPAIGAEGAILMDADSGAILYGKNIHEKLYPASTTKLMTALLAYENLSLDDMVTFSETAIQSITWDSSNIGLDAGESLSVRESLYGLMVGSANEVASGLAEKVGGSIENFASWMNQRAEELGCTDTNFVNANGLFDTNHYTSVYDMALISREVFQYEELSEICNTASYHFSATDTQPDDFTITNKHQLINGEIEYDGILGGKTGYTSDARQTLVTCAQQNGMKLICVIFKEESPAQFEDTVALFDYGFSNFQKMRITDNDSSYSILNPGFMNKGEDIFGSSSLPYSLAGNGYVTIPTSVSFDDLTSEVTYSKIFEKIEEETSSEGMTQEESASATDIQTSEVKYNDSGQLILGSIHYYYSDAEVGSTDLLYTGSASLSEYVAENMVSSSLVNETSGSDSEDAKEGDTAAAQSDETASESNDVTQSHLQKLPGPLGWLQNYFIGIIHRGSNGTVYINIPSLLIFVLVFASVMIVIITIVMYVQYVMRRRRRAQRARARREARRRDRL